MNKTSKQQTAKIQRSDWDTISKIHERNPRLAVQVMYTLAPTKSKGWGFGGGRGGGGNRLASIAGVVIIVCLCLLPLTWIWAQNEASQEAIEHVR